MVLQIYIFFFDLVLKNDKYFYWICNILYMIDLLPIPFLFFPSSFRFHAWRLDFNFEIAALYTFL